MPRPRRRSSAGISLAVLAVLLLATFVLRGARDPRPAERADAPTRVTAPSRADAPAPVTRPAEPSAGSTTGFASRQRLVEHFEKHGEEFPGLSMAAYLAAAQRLRDAAVGGDVLEVRRRDGVVTRFDRASGAFLAVNRDGTIRTFFRPNDGEAYFRRQASRLPGGGP
ncbi:MAG: hypothetical protein V4813_18750 [Gemmatimonadota bacterium]